MPWTNAGWQGQIPQQPWLPWTDWAQVPWATVPNEQVAQQAMAWMNVTMPWMQAHQQQQQFGQQMQQRAAESAWSQGFQEQQFGHQQQADVWAQRFQEEQLEKQLQQAGEAESMRAYGRRWRPTTRWM